MKSWRWRNIHCWEKKHTSSGVCFWPLEEILPPSLPCFLAMSVLIKTWALETSPEDFLRKPVSAMAQQLCMHWAAYQALLICRLLNIHPLEQTFLCFQTSNKSLAHAAPYAPKVRKSKQQVENRASSESTLPQRQPFHYFSCMPDLIQASLVISAASGECTSGLGQAEGRSFNGDNSASAKSVLGTGAHSVLYTVV